MHWSDFNMKFIILLLGLTLVFGQEVCDETTCQLPECSCFTSKTPIEGPTDATPQMVVISFDDAVTSSNHPLYDYLSQYKNPNGCNISMSFFVSHEYTEYNLVYDLYRRGHEIAVHSVTHEPDIFGYWVPADYELWRREMADARSMIVKYGKVAIEDIKGWRAPFLVVGGDKMYDALHDSGFTYDCSWPTLKYTNWFPGPGDDKEPLGAAFPYTMDFPSIELDDPASGIKPDNLYPGFWNAPMVDLMDDRGEPCAMLDACQGNFFNCTEAICQDAVYQFLKTNFDRHYYGNRAPFGLYAHQSWFLTDGAEAHQAAYFRFLGYITSLPDVYTVSMDRVLKWMQNPVSIEEADSSEAFQCDRLPTNRCETVTKCEYNIEEQKRFLSLCGPVCPPQYPWLGNPDGTITEN